MQKCSSGLREIHNNVTTNMIVDYVMLGLTRAKVDRMHPGVSLSHPALDRPLNNPDIVLNAS